MMPAAPLVGAVTTRPPAAFSSFTAIAHRLTQSSTVSGSRVAASGFALSSRKELRCAPGDLEPAGQYAVTPTAPLDAGLHGLPDA